MSAPRRLTPDEIDYVKRIAGTKRRIRERLGKLPTTEQLAERLNVSPRTIERIACDDYVGNPVGSDGAELQEHSELMESAS